MSFWNFLGELALFNMIRNWFSDKPKHTSYPCQQKYSGDYDPDNINRADDLTWGINDMNGHPADSEQRHGLSYDEINDFYDDREERYDMDDSGLYDDSNYYDDSFHDPDEDW